MRSYTCLALVAVSSAFVLPNEQVSFLQHVDQESRHSANEVYSNLPSRSELVDDFKSAFQSVSDDLEGAFDRASDLFEDKFDHYSSKAAEAWDEGLSSAQDAGADIMGRVQQAYQDAQGYATAVADQIEEDSDFGIMGRDHHHHHHHKPNLTVYQIINEAKSTTKLAKLINKFDDLVEALNGTSANFTVFVPPDSVFERIPEDAPKPSKEFLKALLSYHVSPEFYPAGRILVSRTIPSLLKSPALGKKPLPQRLSTNIGLRGLTINYYSRIFKINIFGTNGVIHGVRSFIFPPPSTLKIVELLPSEFSTLELGLRKTGLLKSLNSTKHAGGTFFAPSNGAFARLGPKLNAFLFSDYGLKYLKPLLEYHVAAGATLYSDAFYKATDNGEASEETTLNGVPKGYFHVDLPTLLKDRTLGVDIARYGRFISIKVNGFARVSASDIVAYDGVIQIVPNVLIPPKRLNDGSIEVWDNSKELTEEDLKEYLEPFVQQTSFWEDL